MPPTIAEIISICELTAFLDQLSKSKLLFVLPAIVWVPAVVTFVAGLEPVFANLELMLKACLAAEGKVGLMMNVRRADLEAVVGVLPALQTPTVSALADEEWVDVNSIVEEAVVRLIVPKLKTAGARGIVEYAINKIID